ncbi:MAG: hypothetical protein K8I82_07090 [Anaerolineae bacterium]|nr:hypothetical protein [Anaerolineae bacterium]
MLPKSLTRFMTGAAAILGAFALPALVSFSPEVAAEVPSYTVSISGEGIVAPEGITPGIITLSIDNTAQAEAPAMLFVTRLNDDVTPESFNEGIQAGLEAIFDLSTPLGGLMVAPGAVQDVTYEFSDGTYLIADMAREMPAMTFFEINAPAADFTIQLVDFAFVMPDEIQAGEMVWEIQNAGTEPHEFVVFRINDENLSEQEVRDLVMSDEPSEQVEQVFFWAPMKAESRAWTTVNLEPGSYVFICFLELHDHNHIQEGMIRFVTVTE